MKTAITTTLLILSLFFPLNIHAHSDGKALIEINGHSVISNQAYSHETEHKIFVSENKAPAKYLPKTQLTIEAIEENLGLPPTTVKQIKYQWKVSPTDSTPLLGDTIKHTFDQPGSYNIILEALIPGNPSFTPIDSVQIDIIPIPKYQLPDVVIITPTEFTANEPTQFAARVTIDPSATIKSYLWKLDTNTYSDMANPIHTYTTNLTSQNIFLSVTDSNNLTYTTTATVKPTDNYLKSQISPESSQTKQKTKNSTNLVVLTLILSVIIGTSVLGILLFRNQRTIKKSKNR